MPSAAAKKKVIGGGAPASPSHAQACCAAPAPWHQPLPLLRLQKETIASKHGAAKPAAAPPKPSGGGGGGVQLVLPPCLTARQRAVLHEVAEAHGMEHASRGDGADRHLVLGPDGAAQASAGCCCCCLLGRCWQRAPWAARALRLRSGRLQRPRLVLLAPPPLQVALGRPDSLADDELCALLQQHLSISAEDYFASSSSSTRWGPSWRPSRALPPGAQPAAD
jgi:hypothetical protein